MRSQVILATILVAILGLTIGVAIGSDLYATTRTATETSLSVSTTTLVVSDSASNLYELVFNESGYCPPPPLIYPGPWAVSLNNKTVVEPSNASFPLPEGGITWMSSYKSYSLIVFSVPDGKYIYTVYPRTIFSERGTVVVNGSGVVIPVVVTGVVVPCMAH